jgi:hypothetical protein
MPVSLHQLRSGVWQPLGDTGPTAAPGMLVGAANTIPSSNESGWTSFEATIAGPQTIRRTYSPESAGIPSSWSATQAASDVGKRASVWSFKPNIIQMGNGSMDTALRNFLLTIPDDHPTFISMWPESDRFVRKDVFTAAQWRAAHTRFAAVLRDLAKPRLWIYLSPTSWLWDPLNTSGPDPADVWPGDGQVDCYGQDGYGFSLWPDPGALFGPGVEEARNRGVSWGIFESGANEHPSDATRKANWMRDVADWAAIQSSGGRPGCEALIWFNSVVGLEEEPTGAQTPGSSAQARTAAGEIATEHFRPWQSYTLPHYT